MKGEQLHPIEWLKNRRLRTYLAAGAAALALAGCTAVVPPNVPEQPSPSHSETQAPAQSVNLLTGGTWQLAGAQLKGNELYVTPTNLAITEQDGSEGQINQPVNLFGTHLERKGDFAIDLTVSDLVEDAEISLYGKPPLIEDEFRAELSTLSLKLEGSQLTVSVSDQTDGRDHTTETFPLADTSDHKITLTQKGNALSFTVDGAAGERSINAPGLFGQTIWFGMDTRQGSFTLSDLTARGENGGQVKAAESKVTIPTDQHGIGALIRAKRPDMIFGAALAPGPLVSDARYRELLGNYTGVSIENAAKWQFIHPEPHVYNFAEMDAMVEAALRAGKKIHGHALIFGEANPQWLQDLEGNPEALKKAAIDHITTLVKRYKGRVASWDIINEPLADYDTEPGERGLRKNIYYNTLGPDYIKTMLEAAHAADPKAELWINDFGMESDDERFEQMYDLVKRLIAKGLPVTGIGFQAHIDDGDTIQDDTHVDKEILRGRIKRIEALGLKVRFSEVDISSESEYAVPTDITLACLGSRDCTGVTTWGVTDRYSSGGEVDELNIYHPGFGLLWDKDGKPTPAVTHLKKALR